MESKSKILAALGILRRLPPSKIRQNLAAIVNLQPDIQEELLSKVDQPLGILSHDFLTEIRARKRPKEWKSLLQGRI